MSINDPSLSFAAIQKVASPWALTYCSLENLANEFHFPLGRCDLSPSQLADVACEAAQLADAAYARDDSASIDYVERVLYVLHVQNRFAPPVHGVGSVLWSTLMRAKLRHHLRLVTIENESSIEACTALLKGTLDAVEKEDHPLIDQVAHDQNSAGLATYVKNWYCSTHGFTTQLLSLTQRCNGVPSLVPIFEACLQNIHDEFFDTPHPQLRTRLPEYLGIRYSTEAALGDDDYLTEAFSLQNFRTGIACLCDPTYALGSFYSIEAVFSSVCRRMYPALRARGFPDDVIATFRIHDGADEAHSTAFMDAIRNCQFNDADWANFLSGALVQLKLRSRLFRAMRDRVDDSIAKRKVAAAEDRIGSARHAEVRHSPPNDWRLRDMTLGIAGYPAVLVAHEVGLFRHLADGPKTKDELAGLLKVARRPLDALLYVSSGIGAVMCDVNGYALSKLGQTYFAPTSEFYAGGYFDLLISNYDIYSIDSVRKAVLGDAPQFYGGSDVFKTNAAQVSKAQEYTRGMHGISMAPASAWPRLIDLSGHRHLLDVGGGSGAHSIGAVRAWPRLTAQIFDLAAVCDVAHEIVDKSGMGGRVTTQCGDMWKDTYPDGADVHFYSQIFHDWPEDKCLDLAKRSYAALPNGGRVIVHEILFDDDKSGPFAAAGANIVMLLWYPGGRQYSGLEIGDILRRAGFVDVECRRTFGYWGVVTAVKR